MNPTPLNEFQPFPKIPRLFRRVFVTEKIDGTNACVVVPEDPAAPVLAQSRNRFITPEDDNYGFAAWVQWNAEELRALGPGRHFGEWWGLGINRGYGLTERRFSLFNVSRWNQDLWDAAQRAAQNRENLAAERKKREPLFVIKPYVAPPACCHVVPLLCSLPVFDTQAISVLADDLARGGSWAAPGYHNPEGIVVFHEAGGHLFKCTFGGDGHKGTE